MMLVCCALAACACTLLLLKRGAASSRWQYDPLDRVVQSIKGLPVVRDYQERLSKKLLANECSAQAPHMFDILTLGLSAGLSFDSALSLYLERSENGLAICLKKAFTKWSMGFASRQEALNEIIEDVDVAALRRFISAVEESLSFGVPLAATLTKHAQDIRSAQRMHLEETIEKAPVQILIPMGVFVVPAMLLAILGPLLAGALHV